MPIIGHASPPMPWQPFIISLRHSDIGRSDFKQSAMRWCTSAIFWRCSMPGAGGAGFSGSAAKAGEARARAAIIPNQTFVRCLIA
jgi:hypothetical protein